MAALFRRPSKIAELIAGAVEGLSLATQAHQGTWRFGHESSWNVDQEAGRLTLEFDAGVVASAPVQIVGTYNAADGTFLWGWNHPSVEPALRTAAAAVRELGQQYQCSEFTTEKVSCTEAQAWEYTALAMRLSGASGAYRGEAAPGTFVFMTFGEVQLSNVDAQR